MNAPPPAIVKVFGVNDPRFSSQWRSMAQPFARTGAGQVGVTINWCKGGSNARASSRSGNPDSVYPLGIPATQPALVILTGAPSCFPLTPEARDAYAKFAYALVKGNPNIRELQVWNEPEYEFSAQQYVPLLAATWDAIHQQKGSHGNQSAHDSHLPNLQAQLMPWQFYREAEPEGGRSLLVLPPVAPLILGPGAHPSMQNPPFPAWTHMTAVDFAREVAKEARARKRPVLDGYAYHPYWRWRRADTKALAVTLDKAWKGTPQPRPCTSSGRAKDGASRTYGSERRGLGAQSAQARPGCSLRFWWTETGYWSSGKPWGEVAPMVGTPEQQAQRVFAVAKEARCNPLVAGEWNFLLRDEEPTHAWTWQSGLFTVAGAPKPALAAFRDGTSGRCGLAKAVKR